MDRGQRWLVLGLVVLCLNSSYLAAGGDPNPFYFANLLLHFVLGVALVLPFGIWWWRRRTQPVLLVSGLLLMGSTALGLWLVKTGNLLSTRPILWAHIGLAVLGVAGLVVALARNRQSRASILAAVALIAALVIPALTNKARSDSAAATEHIVNPPASATMAEETMGGESGPFFPSSVKTTHGGTVSSAVYLGPEACARSGCHPDVFDQWESSAHHFSSFNNQWYRKSIEYLQELAGPGGPSKWCGGCHDPALLQSGMMDRPIEELIDTPEAQAGLTCTACHMISSVGSSMGNGDYEITIPPLHDLAVSENPLLREVHDFLLRLDPEPHRRTFLKPFYRGPESPEYCSSCHKVHLDTPVNGYRWIRGFNEYDNWQASGVSGQGARSFYYPAKPQTCIDCHMPHVPSDDAAAKDGQIRSHRFAAANTALPTANKDEEQLQAVTDFLQARQVSIDIFAMTEARPIAEASDSAPALAGPALATSFAVGEEQGMAVGMGGAASGPAAAVFAPLDRIPATVRRGSSTRVDVVVRTRGVGHFFPGGTVDAYDCWVELKAVDEHGRTIYWSGQADLDSPVESGAHFYRSLMIDAHGNPIDKRNAHANRAVVYVRLIPPGAADTIRFRLDVPEDAGDTIELTAKLNYRKFSWFNTNWAYAGVPDPSQEDAGFSVDFDDRRFVFTGDTADVSGALKEIPQPPIVVMAEDRATLAVAEGDVDLPNMANAGIEPGDRERWNDYGIGLFLQGDLRGARRAFQSVTNIEPEYVDGWVNLGRVALAEGDLDEARRVLDKSLALEPDLARTHFFVGLIEKELGEYDLALEHFAMVVEQYPKDRVVRNQIGRVHFLMRDYAAATRDLAHVLLIDPENLMAHYTLMLAYRGLGELERSAQHQELYLRFKADEASQILTGKYKQDHPEDNNESQSIHEHTSVPLDLAP